MNTIWSGLFTLMMCLPAGVGATNTRSGGGSDCCPPGACEPCPPDCCRDGTDCRDCCPPANGCCSKR